MTQYQDGVNFSPRTLTFTPDNWNTAQSVSVKLMASANKTVSLSQGNSPNVITDWTNATSKIAVVLSKNQIGFDSTDWNVDQTFTIKLAAQPAVRVRIHLDQTEGKFTPSILTFTTENWNTAQTVNVQLAEAPPAPPAVSLVPAGLHSSARPSSAHD